MTSESQNSSDSTSDAIAPEANGTEGPARPRIPLPPTWLSASAFLMVGVLLQWLPITGDNAITNVLTLICCIVSGAILAVWFVFLSGHRLLWRALLPATFAVALFAGLAVLRLDHVSGELVPSFSWRWSRPPDELLAPPAAETGIGAAPQVPADVQDFPQFLGPHRNARVDTVALARDWSSRPPRLVWRQSIGAGWSAFAVAQGLAVTLEQRGPEEFVTCYDAATGKLVWAHGVAARHATLLGGVGPRSTPTLADGHVYTLGSAGDLHCLELTTGKVLWHDNLLARYHVPPDEDVRAIAWGRSGSPLLVDGLVVVPAGGPRGGPFVSLAAFQQRTGELVWEGGTRQISYSSPTLALLAGTRQILSVNESHVTGHDPASGRVLWEFEWPGNSTQNATCSQPVPFGSDQLLTSKGYGWGAALWQLVRDGDSLTARQVWHDRTFLKTKFTNLVVYDGHAYGLSDGTLECVEVASGQRRWKKGRYAQGQILGVRDLLLVLSEAGELALVEASPAAFVELGRFPALDGKTWNNLCLVGHRVFLRNATEAACYELP